MHLVMCVCKSINNEKCHKYEREQGVLWTEEMEKENDVIISQKFREISIKEYRCKETKIAKIILHLKK